MSQRQHRLHFADVDGVSGVLYRVETTLDLVNWTTDGVALTTPGSDQRRTAAVSREAASRFLRLVVAESMGAAP